MIIVGILWGPYQKLGYIEEKEAWSQILYGIRELQRAYSSWTEYIIGFALGRQFEANNTSTEYVRQNKRYMKRILL